MSESNNNNNPIAPRSHIRLVKNVEDPNAKKDISDFKTKKPNSLVSQLQMLADSIDAQVKEILEL